jgi:hypothetical protein
LVTISEPGGLEAGHRVGQRHLDPPTAGGSRVVGSGMEQDHAVELRHPFDPNKLRSL